MSAAPTTAEPSSATLLCTGAAQADGADAVFRSVLAHIRNAQQSIRIHMYVWRSDGIGNQIGRALLEAADRGVTIEITKDIGAFMYERIEMNRKSFFDRPIPLWKTITYRLLQPTFPDTYVEDSFDGSVGQAVMGHPNITIHWVNGTHTKYYLFDDHTLLVGSVNIEDRHRGYFDYAVELTGTDTIQQFHRRMTAGDSLGPDPTLPIDFVLNHWQPGHRTFAIKPCILDLLRNCRDSVVIEMAYVGDPDITEALVETAERGVSVTMLCSRAANIGNDINLKTIHRLFDSGHITVYLTPKMIHSKLMLFDDEILLMGSANLSVFSLQKAGELDVILRNDSDLLAALRQELNERIAASSQVLGKAHLPRYNRLVATLQQVHQMLNPN